MDIDGSCCQRFVSEMSLNSQKICPILIEMSAKGMTERVAGNTFRPTESTFMFVDMTRNKKCINRTFRVSLLWKKSACWSVILEPVLSKDIQSIGR